MAFKYGEISRLTAASGLARLALCSLLSLPMQAGLAAPHHPLYHPVPARTGYLTLYLYRPAQVVGNGVWPETFLSGQHVIGLQNGAYTVVYALPGHYTLRAERNSFLSGMERQTGAFDLLGPGPYYLEYETSEQMPSDGYTISGVNSGLIENERYYTRWALYPDVHAAPDIRDCRYFAPSVQTITP